MADLSYAPTAAHRIGREPRRSIYVAMAAFAALAVAVRVAAARGDLWFDEIWSLSFARELDGPWEVLTRIHHDNNHPLNTLALYLTVAVWGPHAPPIAFRALSLVTGIAIIPWLCAIGDELSEGVSAPGVWFTAILSGLSFLAVVYSSEARGYAPAAFFAVAAFALVRGGGVEVPRNRRLALAVVCALGVLSHLTFVFVYAALAAWTLARAARARRIRGWVALHMLPAAFLVGDYIVDVRKLAYGGGPPFRFGEVIARTLSLALNGSGTGLLRDIAAVITVAVVLAGIADLYARRNDEWIFYATALIVAPAAVLLVYQPRYLDPRYFFVLMPFVWLLGARVLTLAWTRGVRGRWAAAAFTGVFAVAAATHLLPFLRYQRGNYMEAVATMARLSDARPITVGSDHDVRNGMVLGYYGETLPPACRLTYVPDAASNGDRPEWYVTHRFDEIGTTMNAPASLAISNGRYRLVRSFPYGGTSGWAWHLYHSESRDPVQAGIRSGCID